ncbi:AAA family ATPase [Pararhizobium sp. BT-229]|uniref:AAA family ATPase n=1 Tax=Pararhizobium sp. BT-229 TaxID=2986923 RepID=UPI0021F7E402|nr:AAA family ATPase [Pararhizobium sp. BT-229]MCV9964035.1 AAA family ATPase [Pararhizobium sp. BT-229]
MPVEVRKKALEKLEHEAFEKYRGHFSKNSNGETLTSVEISDLPLEAINELARVAAELKDRTLSRSVKVFLAARDGDFTHALPNLKAAKDVLFRYLRKDTIDGWVYVRNKAGELTPELVTGISVQMESPPGRRVYLAIETTASTHDDSNKRGYKVAPRSFRHDFLAEDVVNRTVPEILGAAGIFKETPELKAEYEDAIRRHVDEIMPSFAEQFRFTGTPVKTDSWSRPTNPVENRKVINDLEMKDYAPITSFAHSPLLVDPEADGDGGREPNGSIPLHPVIRVFDLKTYEFYWLDSRSVTAYVYNEKLAEKLVLPATHRDLLDVLTNDLSSFTGDIIEGKGTGNVILCTGTPGLGKTLTAEVYAETLKRPLYAIHSGNLGTTASEVEKGLATIFAQATRWNAILLLDESDVFVMERRDSLEVNAVVAVFLRSMEYFNGLMFMTTNRHGNIDDAILSRCLAIVRFHTPDTDGARSIWKMMSTELGQPLADALVDELVTSFPDAAGRDIKQLCGTVFRMVKGGSWKLDGDSFRRAAMFRGVDMLRNFGKGQVAGVEDAEIATLIIKAQDTIEREMGFRPSPSDAMKYVMKKAALAA